MAQDVGTITQLTTTPEPGDLVSSLSFKEPQIISSPTIRIVSHKDGTISFQQLVQQWGPMATVWVDISVVNEDGKEVSKKLRNVFPVR